MLFEDISCTCVDISIERYDGSSKEGLNGVALLLGHVTGNAGSSAVDFADAVSQRGPDVDELLHEGLIQPNLLLLHIGLGILISFRFTYVLLNGPQEEFAYAGHHDISSI